MSEETTTINYAQGMVDAAQQGDAVSFKSQFDAAMLDRITKQVTDLRSEVATTMFDFTDEVDGVDNEQEAGTEEGSTDENTETDS